MGYPWMTIHTEMNRKRKLNRAISYSKFTWKNVIKMVHLFTAKTDYSATILQICIVIGSANNPA